MIANCGELGKAHAGSVTAIHIANLEVHAEVDYLRRDIAWCGLALRFDLFADCVDLFCVKEQIVAREKRLDRSAVNFHL